MAKKLILESTLSNIANAIRGVDGTTALINPSDFASRIATFSAGTADPKAIVKVEASEGATVSATNGSDTLTGIVGSAGALFLLLPTSGSWIVNLTVDGKTTANSLTLTDYDYQIVQDNPAAALIEAAVSAGSLNSLSWADIEIIADALAAGTSTASDASGLLGLSKSFTYSGSTCYAFVVGILQDYLDSTPRGLTFWCVGSDTPFSTSSKQLHMTTVVPGYIYEKGWGGNTGIRAALQSGGSIYSDMPSDMKAVMKSKTTYYGPTYGSTATTVSSVTDIMFILSEKELYNINDASQIASSYYRPSWQYEGTGSAHNEQYQLFTDNGISYSNYSKLVCSTRCCMRTIPYNGSSYIMVIGTNGNPNNNYSATFFMGTCPCFCV